MTAWSIVFILAFAIAAKWDANRRYYASLEERLPDAEEAALRRLFGESSPSRPLRSVSMGSKPQLD